jgi:hypothetical protein
MSMFRKGDRVKYRIGRGWGFGRVESVSGGTIAIRTTEGYTFAKVAVELGYPAGLAAVLAWRRAVRARTGPAVAVTARQAGRGQGGEQQAEGQVLPSASTAFLKQPAPCLSPAARTRLPLD